MSVPTERTPPLAHTEKRKCGSEGLGAVELQCHMQPSEPVHALPHTRFTPRHPLSLLLGVLGISLLCTGCPVDEAAGAVSCGDGLVDAGEECDDGNADEGDGCDASCRVESGYVCLADGEACEVVVVPICGDGLATSGEQCDDGNAQDGDGCSASCELEAGYECLGEPLPCRAGVAPVCGDGILTASEECDDGEYNGGGYGACDFDCTLGPFCGDAVVDAIEECDDGNNQGGDGCNPGCQLDLGL